MPISGFGVCTWLFGELAPERVAERVAALGYDGVELLGDLDRYSPAEIKRILTKHGLQVFSLTPINVDLAHPDTQVREQAQDYYLALVDFATQIEAPLVSCHGAVGRVRPIEDWHQEWTLMVDGVRRVAERAANVGLRVAVELLNRYESHLLNTVEQGMLLLHEVGFRNVGLNLDAYHMNIEEPSPADAVRRAGARLFVFHAADSNRQSVGQGHTDWAAIWSALKAIDYSGPIIVETPAPGPDPFRAIKDESSLSFVETFLRESLDSLKALEKAG